MSTPEMTSLNHQYLLVEVSLADLAISMIPLLGMAIASYRMGLQLESPMVVGMIRTFVQLSILGAILTPIFLWGTQYWEIVVAYVFFMIVLASFEASSRSMYYFRGMVGSILFAFMVTILLISILSFGLIIRPTPVWEPQYVIPIVGMLLGNGVNGVSLAVNSLLTGLVEQSAEIELFLSFGANSQEASTRLTQEAVRVGAMPTLNSMSVIGLISIPGMMTGQILGGSSVGEAARYQMLIMYLIATVTLGTILIEAWIICNHVAFSHSARLDTSHFIKRPSKTNFLSRLSQGLYSLGAKVMASPYEHDTVNEYTSLTKKNGASRVSPEAVIPSSGSLELVSIVSRNGNGSPNPVLELRNVSRTLVTETGKRVLFSKLSASFQKGDIVAVRGPSGIGKTQLLRLVARLDALQDERSRGSELLLHGQGLAAFHNLTHWRRQVRYVSQYKVDIPGTPADFLQRVARFSAWRQVQGRDELISAWSAAAKALLNEWGLESQAMNKNWSKLSGGEAQRVYLAIAVATRPDVLLMDESTSNLDQESKTRVERSIERLAVENGMVVLWITHDEEQVARMAKNV
eukprot:scaffold1139_cov174-Amphora_coffeaeformis.AAC.6